MIRYGIHTGKQNADPTATFEAIKRAGFDAVLISLSGTFDNEKQVEIIRRAGADWTLLLQFASIQEDDYELMFGDVGNLYFYIRKQDLAERNFDKIWLVMQCG